MRIAIPSPAALVAVLALCLATGGVGYAAGSLPKNSVGSKQVKNGALTGKDLKNNSITGADIDERSLSNPVKPGSVLLTGYDFQPRASSYVFDGAGDGGIFSATSNASFTAPLAVPRGATVSAITVFLLDNGPSDIDVFVGRLSPSTGTVDYSSAFSSNGQAGSVRPLAVSALPVVAATTQSIIVYLPVGQAYQLYGARIDYQ